MAKKYALVRVDNRCQGIFEGNIGLCIKAGRCSLCDSYGDTKEQLVRKVQTALKRERIKPKMTYYWLARKIVEFLGVKE